MKPSTNLPFTVLEVARLPPTKVSFDVLLERRASEAEMRTIAHQLREREAPDLRQLFVDYYLPGMDRNAGAWAKSHFRPELEVQILGLSVEQLEALTHAPDPSGSEVIGRWLDDTPKAGRRLTLYRRDDKLWCEQTFPDLTSFSEELSERVVGSTVRYEKTSTPSVYYAANSAGELEIHDSEGLITSLGELPSTGSALA